MSRDYARVSSRFWTGETGRKLRKHPDAQRLAAYLITSPGSNMIGLYYLALPIAAHETGMAIDEVDAALEVLASEDVGFAFYDPHQELIWVPSMADWQIGEQLQPGDKRIKGIYKELANFRRHPFVVDFWRRYQQAFCLGEMPDDPHDAITKPLPRPFEAPSKALRSQEQEQEQEQAQEQEAGAAPEDRPAPLPLLPLEPAGPVEPPVLEFPCNGTPASWPLTNAFLAECQGAFPALDVIAEFRIAHAKIRTGAVSRKTARGMPRFLMSWLGRTNDRGPPQNRGHTPAPQLSRHAEAEAKIAARFAR